MYDDQQRRLDRLRRQVAQQAVRTQRLRLESKEVRAAASAIADQAVALRLVSRGIMRDPIPPIPTHPPD